MPKAVKKAASKKPRSTDVEVGTRIRAHRLRAGLSQTDVADHLGLTFQQVQKYEKGTNRIAPSRLVDLAALLKVSVLELFPPEGGGNKSDAPITAMLVLTTARGQRLANAYEVMPIHARDALVNIAEIIAQAYRTE